ncbi:MFS transporter [Nocardia sp. NRRL S-836]|uniref:MFS transporter n=1 Tax=Nocardia sp. NRRL S-836 TaxID=1519492 RepID=UPI0007C75BC8|nr:MFS transporter [Nocardia sp. NRRL S-836]
MSRALRLWGLVAVGSRMPVAMAPLALVFLGRSTPGGYVLGAAAAAVYVVGEIAGSAVLGARLGRSRRQLPAGMVVAALAFAVLPFVHGPLLLAVVFVAGAAPAAAPGGTRAILTSLVPEEKAARALSAEAVLSQVIWAGAPALVVFLALQVHPGVPLLVATVLFVAGAVVLRWLPAPEPVTAPISRSLWRAWPIYLTSTAANALFAAIELMLPAMLEQRRIPVGWAGPLLAWFALACAGGALLYGLRTWPGSLRAQCLVLLVCMSCSIALTVFLPGVAGIAAGLLVAGLFQSGAMVSRSLTLRERLPSYAHAPAYSLMYAAAGVGYSTSAGVSAVAVEVFNASVAVLLGVAITLVIVVVSAVGERPVVKAT